MFCGGLPDYVIVTFGVKLHVNFSWSKLIILTLLLGAWGSLCIVNGKCGCCCW